jgi:hypothetical protein
MVGSRLEDEGENPRRYRRTQGLPSRVVPRSLLMASLAPLFACTPFKTDPPPDAGTATAVGEAKNPDPAPTGCDPSKPFGPPVFVPGFSGLLMIGAKHMRLSSDYLTAYLDADDAPFGLGSLPDLYMSTRSGPDDPFGPLSALTTLNTTMYEENPTASGDGLTLIFERQLANAGAAHLHGATRPNLSSAFNDLGELANVNSTGLDVDPFLLENGKALYFCSTRNDPSNVDYDIYRAEWLGSAFGAPNPVAELNSSSPDNNIVVSPDDRIAYFRSSRPLEDGSVQGHVWTTQRASPDEPFSPPTVVSELDSPGKVTFPTFLTRDGCTLHLTIVDMNTSSAVYLAQKPPR